MSTKTPIFPATLSIASLWKATNAFNPRGVGGRIALRKEETVVEVNKDQNEWTKVKTIAGEVGDVPTSLLGKKKNIIKSVKFAFVAR